MSEPTDADQFESGDADITGAGSRDLVLRITVPLVTVVAGTWLLDVAQFQYFDCSVSPAVSVFLGIPVFALPLLFPFAVYETWGLPLPVGKRLARTAALALVFAAMEFVFVGPFLLSHMCP